MIEDRRPKSEDRSKMSDEYFSIFNTIKFSIFHYSKLPILHSSGLFPKGCPWQNPFIQNSIIPPFQNSMFNIRYSIFLFLVLTSHIKNQKSDFLYLPISPFRHSISNSFHHSIPSFQYSMFIIQYSIFLFLSLTSHIKNQKSDFLYHLLAPSPLLSISSSPCLFVSSSPCLFVSSSTPHFYRAYLLFRIHASVNPKIKTSTTGTTTFRICQNVRSFSTFVRSSSRSFNSFDRMEIRPSFSVR